MNRRDFLRTIPVIAALPFMRRLLEPTTNAMESTLYAEERHVYDYRIGESAVGGRLDWDSAPRNCRCIYLYNKNLSDGYAGQAYTDDDGTLITEMRNGDKFKRIVVYGENSVGLQSLKMNESGEWEPDTGWTPYDKIGNSSNGWSI